jgi:hypothetical protein
VTEQYKDLGRIIQNKDGDYWEVEISDLDFATQYTLEAAWVFSDKTKGTSPFSDPYKFTTPEQEGLLAPQFREQDLDAINSILYISWSGLNSSLVPYDSSIFKQVNVWIKGGDFGEQYVRYASFFTKAGTIQINATQKSTYCVKLQAESKSGDFSSFSSEFCITMLKQPKAVYDIRHSWDNSGNLSLFWKFDPTFKDATNDNTMADSFGIQLLDEENDTDATWWTSVEKDKLPPLEQKKIISANELQKVFGQFTAFETDYTGAIYVRDKNLQTSFVTGYTVTKYSDPLTAPEISAVKAPMAYNVSYTANSAFDKIYIEESTNSGSTWSATPFVTSSNPAYIPATNSLPRLVRARFSKKLGGFTGYSNIVSVTPDKVDPTDTTAPSNPTDVSASAAVDANDKTGFSLQSTISFTKSSDPDCRGYRVRWTTQTENQVYEYGYVDHPSTGNTVSFTVSGLIPNTTYYYQVASVDQFNNTQSYTTAGTFIAQDSVATAEGSLARLKSYISIGGATGDQFKFGTGILDSVNTSITTTPSLSAAPATGYHGILLNKTGNKNNYWLTTGQIRVGTNEQFMFFNGTDLYLTGDINARSGKISGNVTITGGGSFIAGTPGAPRVQMNSVGIFAYGNTLVGGSTVVTETTQILVDNTTDAPTFITTRAKVGNWLVGTNTISAGGITLNSATPLITATNGGSYVGIRPRQSAGTDIVLWSGNTDSPAINSAASGQAGFQVNANGQLYATGAIISGKIIADSGSSLGGLLGDTSKIYAQNDEPTGGTYKTGDAWIDTNDSNKLYVYDSTKVAPASKWVLAQDSESARTIANLKNKTHFVGGTNSPDNVTGSVSGDLWINSSNKNKPYRYNGLTWDPITDADLATAVQNAQSALDKAAKFGVDGAITSNLAVRINDGAAGSIHSSYKNTSTGQTIIKDQFTSTNPGWFLGWELSGGIIYPAINIGTTDRYLKYSTSGGLEVKGSITATTGLFEGNVTAGGVTIGPSGISHAKFNLNNDGTANFSGTLQAGTLISDSTITAGIIQTSSSSSDRRIVIDSTFSKDTIFFKGISGDGVTGDGKIAVGFGLTANYDIPSPYGGVFSNSFPSLTVSAPTVATSGAFAYPARIIMSNSSAGGIMEINATWTRMKGYVELLNGFDYGTQAVRMISAGTSAPDGSMGKEGSLYFQIG